MDANDESWGPPHGPDEPSAPASDAEARIGLAALSLPYQIAVAVALAVAAVAVCVDIGMVFLHVAPSNTLTKQHGKAIDDWIYPEFEQNWKLFAPNPLQQNIAVQVRAQVRSADGGIWTTGWYDLSAQDGRAIDGNLLPSYTQQNELRRAWDFFVSTHDADNRSTGLRGSLSETYLRRIVSLRLERDNAAGKGGTVDLVQIRSRTTNVPAPEWSDEQVSDKPMYRVLPWWSAAPDAADTAHAADTEDTEDTEDMAGTAAGSAK
ncbi:Collagen-like protein OS=Streptomyces alboniger OX=132473 GN=CP975_17985 PE=4 SV=1 [Streptomyces alboniger]